MADREKVLKGLECCCQMNGAVCRTECPYRDECIKNECVGTAHLCANALELIKSQDKLIHELKIKYTVADEMLTGVTAVWADTLRRIDRV